LLIRIGVTKEWDKIMPHGDRQAYAQSSNPQHASVDGTEELLRWIWNKRFAAGEMFDLDDLGRICEEEKRQEFFMTSAPLSIPGGVRSPPNAIAIF